MPIRCPDTYALSRALRKLASFQYSDGPHGPHNREIAIGKTLPATYAAIPLRGQLSPVTRHSDVPQELQHQLSRASSRTIARRLQKAGGVTAAEGDMYAAVLDARGVNSQLAALNPRDMQSARSVPNDLFQRQKTARLRGLIEFFQDGLNEDS